MKNNLMFKYSAPVYDRIVGNICGGAYKRAIEEIDLKELHDNTDSDRRVNILDVGGGTGLFLKEIEKREKIKGNEKLINNTDVYILDKSRKMLQQAEKKNWRFNLKTVEDKIEEYSSSSKNFDLVTCIDSFHHFENKEKSMEKILKATGEEGEVLILEMKPQKTISKIIKAFEILLGEPTEFWDPKTFKVKMKENGFYPSVTEINSFQFVVKGKNKEIKTHMDKQG